MYLVVGISRFQAKESKQNWCVVSALKNHYKITDGIQAKEFWVKQENPVSNVFLEFGHYNIFFGENGKYIVSAEYLGPSKSIIDLEE